MGWNITREAVERDRNSHLVSVFDQDESESTEEDTE